MLNRGGFKLLQKSKCGRMKLYSLTDWDTEEQRLKVAHWLSLPKFPKHEFYKWYIATQLYAGGPGNAQEENKRRCSLFKLLRFKALQYYHKCKDKLNIDKVKADHEDCEYIKRNYSIMKMREFE